MEIWAAFLYACAVAALFRLEADRGGGFRKRSLPVNCDYAHKLSNGQVFLEMEFSNHAKKPLYSFFYTVDVFAVAFGNNQNLFSGFECR